MAEQKVKHITVIPLIELGKIMDSDIIREVAKDPGFDINAAPPMFRAAVDMLEEFVAMECEFSYPIRYDLQTYIQSKVFDNIMTAKLDGVNRSTAYILGYIGAYDMIQYLGWIDEKHAEKITEGAIRGDNANIVDTMMSMHVPLLLPLMDDLIKDAETYDSIKCILRLDPSRYDHLEESYVTVITKLVTGNYNIAAHIIDKYKLNMSGLIDVGICSGVRILEFTKKYGDQKAVDTVVYNACVSGDIPTIKAALRMDIPWKYPFVAACIHHKWYAVKLIMPKVPHSYVIATINVLMALDDHSGMGQLIKLSKTQR